MSREQEFIKTSISSYSKLGSSHASSDSIVDDDLLTSDTAKDNMIRIPERIPDVLTTEAAKLKSRRNNDHSVIYRLPLEIFIEILLLAIDWLSWDTEKLRTLASVSTYWRDTITSCNRFWSVIDVMASENARRMAMKRNKNGPVDVWCWSRPGSEIMNAFVQDVKTVHSSRWRTILYEYRPETQAFLEHLRTKTPCLVDVLFSPVRDEPAVPLELSPVGAHLRHVDVRGMYLPWQSPRLTNLSTLCLGHIYHGIPHLEDLYQILSTSPRLERLCLTKVNSLEIDQNSQESLRATSRPILLPLLTVLAFDNVSKPITHSILPLIRTTSCKTAIVKGEGDFSVILEPQETNLELIAQPIKVSESLRLKLETEGNPHVHIYSTPAVSSEWVYWAFDKPGVDIKLAVRSADILARSWNQLTTVLQSYGEASNITKIEIEWPTDSSWQGVPFPVGLLEFCPALTTLQVTDYSTTTLTPLVRLLRKTTPHNADSKCGADSWLLPKVNTFIFHAQTIHDLEKCATGVKDFLETRYPSQHDDNTNQNIASSTPIKTLKLPSVIVARLRTMDISTCLKFDDVIQDTATENA
ncbi:hypothetical protein FRC04_012141 [Tulasnella sp. 424]|nr:hypothetical protein FRC04_012141 [Tulasnella sp. 424]KAG8971051.1 hypothetical protein FRC05_011517 [Tulasnella sp. 425]